MPPVVVAGHLCNKEVAMKKGLLFILSMFLMGVCFAETTFTYEKKSKDVLKILEIETTQRISETNITMPNLRVKITNLKGIKDNAFTYYTESVAKIDKEIAFIETQIDKAIELGVKEPIVEIK